MGEGRHLNERLDAIQAYLAPIEGVVHEFANSLGKPIFYHSGHTHAGFRYAKPDERHFCLLKLVRAVSALNAAICLARSGYSQEIAVLIRTFVECTSLIEFVLVGRLDGKDISSEAKELVDIYFADFARNGPSDYKKSKLRQGQVHAKVGAEQDRLVGTTDEADAFRGINSEQLLWRVYQTYSGYVHCRYPETMDLCGGAGPKFHLRGMNDTPKDEENAAILEEFATSLGLSTRSIILRLGLSDLVSRDAAFAEWYKRKSAVDSAN